MPPGCARPPGTWRMAKKSMLTPGRYSPQPAFSSLGNSGHFVSLGHFLQLEWWHHPSPGASDQEGCASGCWARTKGLMKMGRKAPEWLVELLGANPAVTGPALPSGLGCALHSHLGAICPVHQEPRACIQKHSSFLTKASNTTGWPLLCSFLVQHFLTEKSL